MSHPTGIYHQTFTNFPSKSQNRDTVSANTIIPHSNLSELAKSFRNPMGVHFQHHSAEPRLPYTAPNRPIVDQIGLNGKSQFSQSDAGINRAIDSLYTKRQQERNSISRVENYFKGNSVPTT